MYKIMMDLAEATAFIHKNNICNRDMKAENVMLAKKINSLNDVPYIKVIDFGLATRIEKNGLVSLNNTLRVGTTNFKSPELIKGERYGALTDVWSLGIIYYDLYRYNTPFENGFESKCFFNESVINFDMPSAVLRAILPVKPSVTII